MTENMNPQRSFSDIWNDDICKDLFPDLNILQSNVAPSSQSNIESNEDSRPNGDESYLLNAKAGGSLDIDSKSKLLNLPETSKTCQVNSCISALPLPSSDYPGPYGFEVGFGKPTNSAAKSTNFTFSHNLNKLFAQNEKICPIQFKCVSVPPSGCFIRAVPFYTKPEHITNIVSRCQIHKAQNSDGSVAGNHLVLADMPKQYEVSYNLTKDGRESVCVTYEEPRDGIDHFTILYQFACLSSCSSGINRRPLALAFYLEDVYGFELGRRIVKLCICRSPGRDRFREEEKLKTKPLKQKPPSGSLTDTRPKRVKKDTEDNDIFTITVKGKEKYERLLAIKQAFDLADLVPPEQKQQYLTLECPMESK